jgi:hypothetical protein
MTRLPKVVLGKFGTVRRIDDVGIRLGFLVTKWKMSSRNCLLTHFLPMGFRRREGYVQYSLNPAWCQRTRVFGWITINASFHFFQARRNNNQNNLSGITKRGEDADVSRW